jgi:hypothetical protein
MGIWLAAVMATTCLAQDDGTIRSPYVYGSESDASTVDGVLIPRLGVWTASEFKFQATRTDGKVSTSNQNTLFSASVMGGVQFYDHFRLLASVEGDFASKISSEVAGAYIGWHQRPKERYGKGVPDEATVYAGVVAGKLAVHENDFGDFDRGVGFSGGISLGWTVSSSLTVDFIGEYRNLKFDYRKDVASGSTSIGGSGAWIGMGLEFRF